jgi:alkylhydroperoxidase/carboxymuconolactone decarboxylase family protein YurZ
MDPGEKLLRLVLHDEDLIEAVLGPDADNIEASGLDARTHAIIRLGALLALDAPSVLYQWDVDEAFRAGVTPDEIVGCLIAAAPVIGIPRVVAAAPDLANMIGYDIDAALEATK